MKIKPKIQISNLYKQYENGNKKELKEKKYVISDLNLNIYSHEFICILGKSGCGKSTLLNLLAGYIKPDKGEILVDYDKVTGPDKDRGVVFQEHALFPWYTVEENIAFGPTVRKKSKEDIKESVDKYIKMVGLEKYRKYYPDQLSGGMKQRVGIARVFANESDILLMDEPFSALDNFTRENMQLELLTLWSQNKATIIFITHSIEEAVTLADRVIVLGNGSVLADKQIELKRKRDTYSQEFIKYVNYFNSLIEEQRSK